MMDFPACYVRLPEGVPINLQFLAFPTDRKVSPKTEVQKTHLKTKHGSPRLHQAIFRHLAFLLDRSKGSGGLLNAGISIQGKPPNGPPQIIEMSSTYIWRLLR